MKKITLLLWTFALCGFVQAQKNIAGTWQGTLTVPTGTLRLVVHLQNTNGNYTATLDSPDQGAKGIPVSGVQVQHDSLLLQVAAAGAQLSGRLLTDSTFAGYWIQGGARLPLTMKKGATEESSAKPNRPQTPAPPFPYESQDVLYYNTDSSLQYGATLTRPHGSGPFPAVLLITGSGPQNRDEELFGHKPFAVLADYLTRRGFVVLRVDDRGVGQTTGNFASATSADFAADAAVSLGHLKTLPFVNPKKLGLLGHSEGGMIAQMLAADRRDLNFIILLAAPGVPVQELLASQNRAILQSAGLPAETIDRYIELYTPLVATLTAPVPDSVAKAAARQVLNAWVQKTPPAIVLATTGITNEADKEKLLAQFTQQVRTPWFRYFVQYNPAPMVKKISAKVLALNGSKDIQVVAKPNLDGLKAALQKSHARSYEVIELQGLNHLFQHCRTCTVNEYGQLEETFAPEALESIGKWLQKEVQ